MANNSLGFVRKFGHGDFFFVETLKITPDCLYEDHILFFGVNIW